jgi:CubicO group peptidase (beta-lactamase class C family)
VAACANLLAQRGQLDIDAPVASYWPEFAQAGKEAITVRWVLSHQAGLPYVDRDFPLADILEGRPIIEALERQAPAFEPGTAHCYHALTYGWLVGELVRRITGVSVGSYFATEFAGPLGLDFWIGLPAAERGRVAPTLAADDVDPAVAELMAPFVGPGTPLGRAGFNGALDTAAVNSVELWSTELPAGNGIANAGSLARFYAGLIGPLEGASAAPILTPEQIDAARTTQNSGPDWLYAQIPGVEAMLTYGLGFMTPHLPSAPYGAPGAFGHSGMGGSFGFADPDHGIALAYVMNKQRQALVDPRRVGLVQATYDAIGVPI